MANNQSEHSPKGLALKLQKVLNGVQQTLPTESTMLLGGGPLTQAQLAAKLAGCLPAMTAVDDAKAAHVKAVQARRAAEPNVREFLAQVRMALVAFYGRGNPQLEKFGLSAKLPAAPTSQAAILAAAKRTLTRRKRGTMGKKQKAGLKALGTPQVSVSATGVQVTPAAVDEPTAPSVESSPAPVAPAPTATPTAK